MREIPRRRKSISSHVPDRAFSLEQRKESFLYQYTEVSNRFWRAIGGVLAKALDQMRWTAIKLIFFNNIEIRSKIFCLFISFQLIEYTSELFPQCRSGAPGGLRGQQNVEKVGRMNLVVKSMYDFHIKSNFSLYWINQNHFYMNKIIFLLPFF